jgi:membrane protein implicated in regulation of membrane protease activity
VYSVIAACLVLATVLYFSSRTGKQPASRDPFLMIGLEGIAQETFAKEGMVFVRGELWRATTPRGIITQGSRIVVRGVQPGLLLTVESVNSLEATN